MQPLNRRPQPAKLDPAPSRWSWRMQRLMLTPLFRFGLRVGMPFVLTFGIGIAYLSNPERQAAITDAMADARASIEERPEFMVNLMAIDGAGTGRVARVDASSTVSISGLTLRGGDLSASECGSIPTATAGGDSPDYGSRVPRATPT